MICKKTLREKIIKLLYDEAPESPWMSDKFYDKLLALIERECAVEYRACEKCGKPFPCSFKFEGTPICFDCFEPEAPKPECECLTKWIPLHNPKCFQCECICHTPKEEPKNCFSFIKSVINAKLGEELHKTPKWNSDYKPKEPEKCGCGEPDAPFTRHRIGEPCYYLTPCKHCRREMSEGKARQIGCQMCGGEERDYYTKQEIDSQTQLLFEMMKSIPKAARYIDAFIEEKKEFKRAFPFL